MFRFVSTADAEVQVNLIRLACTNGSGKVKKYNDYAVDVHCSNDTDVTMCHAIYCLSGTGPSSQNSMCVYK